jgi:hypothetical protein
MPFLSNDLTLPALTKRGEKPYTARYETAHCDNRNGRGDAARS